jgi:cellulose synthase/poly-beta-1,6-N-acetylglucosamine synthase-like glycosyltransferase
MPVRNAEATLARSLESVRRQRQVAWECIVVDDGSSDQSRRCLELAQAQDPRFRVFPQPWRGIVASLNHGLEHCRGEYVARMDADDVMHRDRLRLQVALLEARPELGGLGCHVRIFPRRGLLAGRIAYEAWLNSLHTEADLIRDAFVECPLSHPSLILRRALLQRHGYRDQGWPEDYDLILRLLGAGERLGVVPRRLLFWRDGPDRLSRRAPQYAIERFTACKAHYLAQGFLRRGRSYVLWGYGSTGRTLARALAAHDKHPCAIIELHPGRLGQRIAGAPVIGPEQLRTILEPSGPLPLVVSVARPGPRREVREALQALGFQELRDYLCAA